MITAPPGYYGLEPNHHAIARTRKFAISTTNLLVLPESFARVSATITNNGTAGIYVGTSQALTDGEGHALPAGVSITILTSAELYAVASTGTQEVTTFEEVLQ